MKTVLVFVLSSHTAPYGAMINTAMATWDAEPLDGTKTVYYCGKPTGNDTDRIISFYVENELATIGKKTLMAFRHALQWPWDYLARPNASCYVHKRRLLEHCQNLPELGLISGVGSEPHWACGIKRPFLWGGGQFIFSRDVVVGLLANEAMMRHDIMEDVALSELARECGFDLDGTGRMCSIDKDGDKGWNVTAYGGKPGFHFSDWKDVAQADDQFFWRCKHDPDRNVDALVMRLLKEHLPP